MNFGKAAAIVKQRLDEVASGTALEPSLRKFISNPEGMPSKELVTLAIALLNRAKVNSKASELSRIDSRVPHVIEMLEKIQKDI